MGSEGVLIQRGGADKVAEEYESDVSDSGTTVGSTIISSRESSPSSSSMSFGERPSPGRERVRASVSSSSSESLEHLYFIPNNFAGGQTDHSNDTTQEVSTPEEEDADGVQAQDMEAEATQRAGVPEESKSVSGMETPKKPVMIGTGPETPKKRGQDNDNIHHPRRRQGPKGFSLLKLNGQGRISSLKHRTPRRVIYSSGSYIPIRGVQKIALRTVKNRMKPVENLLSSILDTIRLHITTTVREQVEGALGELRSFLDGRLPLPRNKGKGPQPRQGRKKKGEQEAIEKGDRSVQDKDKQVKNEDKQKSTGENQLVAVNNDKAADDCSNEVQAVSSPSESSGQESGSGKRIIWANKRMRSETLVKKLKKYLEQNEAFGIPENTPNSESPEDTGTPPNSPASNKMNSPAIAQFTLGMVKIEPVDDIEDTVVPDEVLTAAVDQAMFDNQNDAPNPTSVVSEPSSTIASMDLTGSAENTILLQSGLGPEPLLKPELPITKNREPIICDVCNKSFLNNSSLKQHMSFHRPQRPFKCRQPDCDKSYKTKSELNRHLVVHAGQKNYECKQCGKKFLRKQYLKTHLLRHSEPLTKQCSLCLKIFVSEEDHDKHKLSYHKNGKRSFAQVENKLSEECK